MTGGSSLPGVLSEIADSGGTEAAWTLARTCGGTTIYIPAAATPGHWLSELVGLEAAQKICAHFRVADTGARLLIPLARHVEQRRRLVQALQDGFSAPQAAQAAGMHERTAFRMRARMRSSDAIDDRQPKLI